MTVNTKKVTGRSGLHFNCENCLLADAREIAGNVEAYETVGNWSIGEQFSHVARTMEASVNGFGFTFSLPLRLVGKMLKGRFLNKGFSKGFKFNSDAAKAIGPDEGISVADGFKQLEDAVALFQSTEKRALSPVLGKLTLGEWVKLHARHAELHFGFIKLKGA